MRRRIAIGAIFLAAGFLLQSAVQPYVRGFTLVVRAADLQGAVRRIADVDVVSVRERTIHAPVKSGPIRARVYLPTGTPKETVLLVSGLHPAGIDEPRLMRLAQRLAEANLAVVTPELPELSRFEIRPALTDQIEEIAVWLATTSGLAADGRIGLMGISFSGGLAVVAAGRPSLRGRLSYVFSLGGHDDLRRVLEYFCGGDTEGSAPHDYGVAIVALNVAEHLVPPDQLASFRDGVRRFLWASYLDTTNKDAADREFAALRGFAATVAEPSATLLGYVNNRDVARLGTRLRPYIDDYVDAPALSPSRSPGPEAPVFLLHGHDDNVIPASESEHLAGRLATVVPVRLLITNLISHADADQPVHVRDVLELVAFWADLLDR